MLWDSEGKSPGCSCEPSLPTSPGLTPLKDLKASHPGAAWQRTAALQQHFSPCGPRPKSGLREQKKGALKTLKREQQT